MGFPKDPTQAKQRIGCPISNGEAVCTFEPEPAGTYAIACFHDENGNRKMDTNWAGIPTEGHVTSNEAKGFMSAPSFKAAKFILSETRTELTLRMQY
jgi:uncharacterized protein (DUF2141 family)